MGVHYTSHSQSVVAGPEALTPPVNLLECKYFGLTLDLLNQRDCGGAQQFILTVPLQFSLIAQLCLTLNNPWTLGNSIIIHIKV